MSIDFILPDIGEGIVECEIVEWLVKEGDYIEEDQPVADVSTDKALVQIPSMHHGRVLKLYYQEGDIAKVHSPLFSVATDEGEVESESAPEPPQAEPLEAASPAPDLVPDSEPEVVPAGKVLTTPAVRRIARERALDLTQVAATGKNGRVLKEDVLRHLAKGDTAGEAPAAQVQDRVEAITGVRALMAKAMVDSVSSIPHFTYVDEVDMTALIALRQQLKEKYEPQGIRFTLMPLLMKALSLALTDFPIINSRPNEDCTELHYIASHNIGMAVDSKVGLLVPNVKHVEQRSLLELAEELNRLTAAAREGRLAPADLANGTVTISNVGAIGGTAATPIINKPQVAIVALGKVQSLPRFDADGQVRARQLMNVSWSGDHRVIDGATMARFNNRWKEFLEDPATMLMAMR